MGQKVLREYQAHSQSDPESRLTRLSLNAVWKLFVSAPSKPVTLDITVVKSNSCVTAVMGENIKRAIHEYYDNSYDNIGAWNSFTWSVQYFFGLNAYP